MRAGPGVHRGPRGGRALGPGSCTHTHTHKLARTIKEKDRITERMSRMREREWIRSWYQHPRASRWPLTHTHAHARTRAHTPKHTPKQLWERVKDRTMKECTRTLKEGIGSRWPRTRARKSTHHRTMKEWRRESHAPTPNERMRERDTHTHTARAKKEWTGPSNNFNYY